jgi:hypothetical protein
VSKHTTARDFIGLNGKVDSWGKDFAKQAELKELANKLNEEARENWDSESWHRQVAADLAESLDYGFVFENLFSSYIDVETVGEFDRVIIRERRGLKVFYTSRGGYIDESQLRNEHWELPRDTLGFHVSEHIDKLRANFAETISDLASLGQSRLEAEVNRRLLSLAQAAVPSSSPNYQAVAGLAKTDLDTAIRNVRDAIKPDGVGAVPVTVLGRATMIDLIAEFTPTFSPVANEEVRQAGFLGHYKGAGVVVVRNYADEDGIAYMPGNELWVIGGTAGKFALYGGLQVKSWDENTVDYRHYRARKDVGGLIHHPEQVRRIVDSTHTA